MPDPRDFFSSKYLPNPDAQLPKGIGTSEEVDQANKWLQIQPWYRDFLRGTARSTGGQLSGAERDQLLKTIRDKGVGVSGDFEIDPSGNIVRSGHKLRNAIIAGGIGAGAIFGAPALMGFLGGGGGAAGAGLGSIEAGATGVGGLTATSLGLPVTAGLGTAGTAAAVGGGAAGLGSTLASGTPAATGAHGMAGNFLGMLKPSWTDLIGTGIKGIGGFLSGRSEGQDRQREMLMRLMEEQQRREDAQRTAMSEFLSGNLNRQQSQAQAGLQSTQMDPYAQQKALNAANVRRSFAGGGAGTPGGFRGGFDMSALSPGALTGANEQFQRYVGAASPNVPLSAPDADKFRQGYQGNQQQMMDQIMAYLQQIGSPVRQQPTLPRV